MAFSKSFDKDELFAELKAQGLPVVEDVVEKMADILFDWAAAGCALHENAFVKMGAPAIAAVKPFVKTQIDKIDGKEG